MCAQHVQTSKTRQCTSVEGHGNQRRIATLAPGGPPPLFGWTGWWWLSLGCRRQARRSTGTVHAAVRVVEQDFIVAMGGRRQVVRWRSNHEPFELTARATHVHDTIVRCEAVVCTVRMGRQGKRTDGPRLVRVHHKRGERGKCVRCHASKHGNQCGGGRNLAGSKRRGDGRPRTGSFVVVRGDDGGAGHARCTPTAQAKPRGHVSTAGSTGHRTDHVRHVRVRPRTARCKDGGEQARNQASSR